MAFDFTNLLDTIVSYDTICLFRHEHPDCDALGSQNAFALFLKTNFPNKHIYRLGYQTTSQAPFPPSDIVSDDIIQNALAICLDTANAPRIDDQRFLQAKHVVKIDHHPDREPFGDQVYVFTQAAATCEILSTFMQQSNLTVTKEIATYLYMGLLTDTLSFKTNNTTPHTLQMASFLANFGIDIPMINRTLFDKSMEEYLFANKIRQEMIFEEGVAYTILDQQTLHHYHLTPSEARNFINEYGSIKEVLAWAIFTEREDESNIYDGSLRAKSIIINDLASIYHGGGHPQAAGVKSLSRQDISNLIHQIQNKLKNA